jgi:transcriptional regulator with XRE-family HTH domain
MPKGTQMSGARLKERREALKLSVYDLARELEVLPTTVYRWEHGTVQLKGLMAIGADTVLKRLEQGARRRRSVSDDQ